jgi:hypothetical protein
MNNITEFWSCQLLYTEKEGEKGRCMQGKQNRMRVREEGEREGEMNQV